MTNLTDATLAQIKAGKPAVSTWLSANAGSGKTRVLTDRVARLLLAGVLPERILCLTYTKAAASEMQNRLFKRLGSWTMLPQDQLITELAQLGENGPFSDADIKRARTLFAQAIEASGGLKIQTIHSFCSALLRRFPLEARVSPQFREVDDQAQSELMKSIIDSMAETTGVFDDLASLVDETKLHDLLADILKAPDIHNTDQTQHDLWTKLGLRPGYSEQDLVDDCFTPSDFKMLEDLADVMQSSKAKTDTTASGQLAALDLSTPTTATLATLEEIFLTKKGELRKAPVPTKGLRKTLPYLTALESFEQRVFACRQNRLCLKVINRSSILNVFAAEFLTRYKQKKDHLGYLDFDDLIRKTKALLQREGVAGWVLYKLDGGIDHILVDEAQDTSPDQWDIIKILTAEITSGEGTADDASRTVFVVGDKKQSIYSFQGADPTGFDRMHDHFQSKFENLPSGFQTAELRHSFRSAPAILNFTDKVFDQANSGLLGKPDHAAFKTTMPGRVDVWPSFEALDQPEPLPWTSPVDEVSPDHPDKRLAESIAAQIKFMIANEQIIVPAENGDLLRRNIRPDDFLILVRGRKARIFRELHRACKSAEIEIAGADRMVLTEELAVKDVLSLLNFLATPEDSLALAEALKSPLFGWDDAKLFDLAHARSSKYLWRELERRQQDFPHEHQILRGLRDISDFERPFEIIQKILVVHSGRQKLVSRLGKEAEEALDALLTQAMAYETNRVPSLTDFLVWISASEAEIKRQMDSSQNQVRIMTVHGAKGLEAPIVILPDTAKKTERLQSNILDIDGTAFWLPKADEIPQILDRKKRADLDHGALENDRLLYVALTRAESWLIVAGSKTEKSSEDDAWYPKLLKSAEDLQTHRIAHENGEIVRYETGDWSSGVQEKPEAPNAVPPSKSLEFSALPAPEPAGPAIITPSDLGGTKALPTETAGQDFDVLAYGTVVHELLEHLPKTPREDWRTVSNHLAAAFADMALAEASLVLQNPDLAFVFSDETLAEVDLSADAPNIDDTIILGTVDRLIINDVQVLAIDFKTNRVVPEQAEETPDGILRQMGAYAAALESIFPGHNIETAVLWTKTQTLMRLPHHIVMTALQKTTSS